MVNMPDFQGSADTEPVIREAVFSEPPGMHNSYKVGDKVWVAFIREEKQFPVVIGKITNSDTIQDFGNSFSVNTLNVLSSATLPSNLTFKGAEAGYGTLKQLINKIKAATNFIETNANLEYTLQHLPEQGENSDTPGESGGISQEELDTLIQQVIEATAKTNEYSTWSNITAVQTQKELQTDFAIGKILYVKNDAGKTYSFQSEIDIYPIFSLSTNYLTSDNPVVEFSNAAQTYTTSKVAGTWRVKDIFSGGVLAQRYDIDQEEIDNRITLSDGTICYLTDSYGNARSYFCELTDLGVVHTPILSRDLIYLNKNKVPITNLTSNKEDDVTVHFIAKANELYNPNDAASQPYIILQRYDGDPRNHDVDGDGNNNDTIDNITVLNMPSALINKGGYSCRFKTHTNQTTMFTHTNNSGAGTEVVLLPNDYNLIYKDTYGEISPYLFTGAAKLSTIYIPSNTALLSIGAFSNVGSELRDKKQYVRFLNLENSCVHCIRSEVFQNVAFENNCIKLPKMPLGGIIYFDQKAFGYYNYNGNHPKLKTIFASSVLDFDHAYNASIDGPSATPHNGAFCVTWGSVSYTNSFARQLVLPTDKQWTHDILKRSSIVSFLRINANQKNLSLKTDETPVFGSAVTDILNQFLNAAEDDFTAETILTDDVKLQVRFINAAKCDYDLQSESLPSIPTILYNYKY
jgi:hypothetical protein